MSQITHHGGDVWTVATPLRLFGLALGARMTVVRDSEHNLTLVSPVNLTAELVRALAELGRVRAVAAPNLLHHTFVSSALAAFPGALLYAPARLAAKRPDLRVDHTLPDATPPGLGVLPVRGIPTLDENVFLHAGSRTLIATDLIFNIARGDNLLTRLYLGLTGARGKPVQTAVFRRMVRNRGDYRASIKAILDRDFDRLIVAHGAVIETGAKEALREATAWAA